GRGARHHHGGRREARRGDAFPLGTHEARGRADRRARGRGNPLGRDRRPRQARRYHHLRRQRRPQGSGSALRVIAFPVLGSEIPKRESALMRAVGRGVLRFLGWHMEGEIPNLPKMVIAVAPHTSNWDFVVGAATMFALDLRLTFLGKHTLFEGPLAGMFRWMG